MQRRYFIVDKQTWLDNVNLFSHSKGTGSLFIDLELDAPDDNLILVCAWFHDESHEVNWEQSVGADGILPHPALEGTKSLHKDKHIAKLAKKLGLKNGDTVLDVSKALRGVVASMALTQFDSA
jgi:hypothetical protein